MHETQSNDVETGYTQCDRTMMRATGIPPYLVIANTVGKLQDEVKDMKQTLSTKLNDLPKLIVTAILEKCAINGAIPVTKEDIVQIYVK